MTHEAWMDAVPTGTVGGNRNRSACTHRDKNCPNSRGGLLESYVFSVSSMFGALLYLCTLLAQTWSASSPFSPPLHPLSNDRFSFTHVMHGSSSLPLSTPLSNVGDTSAFGIGLPPTLERGEVGRGHSNALRFLFPLRGLGHQAFSTKNQAIEPSV